MALAPGMTLAELVIQRPASADLLERLRLDYCCGGARSVEKACAERGLDAATVIAMLEAIGERPEPGPDVHDVRRASITELCDHIVLAHHEPERRELPRISELLDTVVRVHGGGHPELADLRRVFSGLRAELEEHFTLEEETVFPACRAVDAAASADALDDGVLALCEDSHEFAGEALSSMRELSGGYDVEHAFCGTHRSLLEALQKLELDLHQHVHEENNVLFPRVRERLA